MVDGPVACPFVAFDDDRDERETTPDHRHRCYAETPPAPRALAHQEAYCLSAAFPVCPIFQDWARREAAQARHEAPPPARAPGASPVGGSIPVGLGDLSGGDDLADEPVYEDPPPRRNPRQGWASPPPWMRRGEPDPEGGLEPAEDPGNGDPDDAYAAEGGLAGSFADRLASSTSSAGGEPTAARVPADAPVWRKGDSWDDEIAPTHEPAEREPGKRAAAHAEAPVPVVAPVPPVAPPRYHERERARAEAPDEESHPTAGSRQGSDRKRDLVAPSWERPARLEAYPTLRSRRMPDISFPPILVALVAILLAALVLFLLPGFLGIGAPQAGTSPTPSLSASSGPLGSLAPTLIPEATAQSYIVQSGDTMSKIAKRFHVTLQALIDANKTTIPNPDNLKIGDVVIIPTATPTLLPGASPAASP
jgi:nucleoid-associated protein YgaU